MAKKAYRVRNWREYNKALVNRGRISFWIDEKAIKEWYLPSSNNGHRGRPKKYSNTAVLTILVLKQAYRLTLRNTQGFMESLFQLLGINLEIPSYTQICRRQGEIQLPKFPMMTSPIHLVVDSTGLKIYGEGEWKVRQHGWSKHRTWRKLHIGIDEKSNLIVCADLTENSCGDDKMLPKLLEQYPGSLSQVSADGAYDSHANFDLITSQGAIPTIPTQPHPKHKSKKKSDVKRARDEVVWQIQKLGRDKWKQESGYHRRSLAENAIYRYKSILGERLLSRKLENQRSESLVRCHMLNQITMKGMPISVEI